MEKEYWRIVVTQILYVAIGLICAIVLWKTIPEFLTVKGNLGPFQFGGAFAGFMAVLWFMNNTGPIKIAKKTTLINSESSIKAETVFPPTQKERYNYIFDDFSNSDFYAFNPPFEVEHIGSSLYKASIKTHMKRYESNVYSRYLFFNEENYNNGIDFFNDLSNQIGHENLKEHADIVFWPEAEEMPGYTFFLGKKKGKSAIILYPKAFLENGLPKAVIYLLGAEELHTILLEFFQKKWNTAIEATNKVETIKS